MIFVKRCSVAVFEAKVPIKERKNNLFYMGLEY